MSENTYTLKLENGDITFNQDNQLQMINDVAQQYKILLETQFESDYRDPLYGFKLQELMQTDYSDFKELLELYAIETAMQHPRTNSVKNIEIEEYESRKYRIIMEIELKPLNETILVGGNINV